MQHKKNITPYNNNEYPHGFWEKYWRDTNNLFYKCYYIDFKEYGYEIIYGRDGTLKHKHYHAI